MSGSTLTWASVAFAGCGWWTSTPSPHGRCADLEVPRERRLELEAPTADAPVQMGWTPVMVKLPKGVDVDPVASFVCLDGVEVPVLVDDGKRRPGVHSKVARGSLDLGAVDDGDHSLVAVLVDDEGALWSAEGVFTLARPAGRVEVRVVDQDGAPVSARLMVLNRQGVVELGSPTGMGYKGRDESLRSDFALGGTGTLFLEPGRYKVLAVRSLFDGVGEVRVDVPADGPVELVVPRQIDLGGRTTADLHVHTQGSYDSQVPDELRYASLVAAGLDVAVITDHNVITDPRPLLEAMSDLGIAVGTVGLPGVEADMFQKGAGSRHSADVGHFNAFPVEPDGEDLPEVHRWAVGQHIDAYRERQTLAPFLGETKSVLLQLNHPRGIQFTRTEAPNWGAWPMFKRMGFDPDVPIGQDVNAWMTAPLANSPTTPMDWDALEVVNRFSIPLWRLVRKDWFALLNGGLVLTGTGNSDSHALQVELAGMTVNVVDAPAPDPYDAVSVGRWTEAVVDGRVVVSTGPLVDLQLGDQGPGGTHVGLPGQAVVRVRAASWVPVVEVRLVVDGVVVQRHALPPREEGEILDQTFRWDVPLVADGWVLAEAGVPEEGKVPRAQDGVYGKLAPGYAPIGFTNPVFVDVDGNGWVAPGVP